MKSKMKNLQRFLIIIRNFQKNNFSTLTKWNKWIIHGDNKILENPFRFKFNFKYYSNNFSNF